MKKIDLLKKLQAKEEPYYIKEVDLKLKLRSFTFDELSEFSRFSDNNDIKGSLKFTMFSVLRYNFPTLEEDKEEGFSDDDIRDVMKTLDGKIAMDMLKRVQVLSGLMADESKKETENQEAKKELNNQN